MTRQDVDRIAGPIIDLTIRIGVVLLLVVMAFRIVSPFINPILWGAILAVAFFPLYLKVSAKLGGRRKTVGVAFIIASVALIMVPSGLLVSNTLDGATALAEHLEEGDVKIPPPGEKVKEWPIVGEKAYSYWDAASRDIRSLLVKFKGQLAEVGGKLMGIIAGAGKEILGMTFSFILAGIFMINGEACSGLLHRLGNRLAGEAGDKMVDLATGTIRGVATGVVGTAAIQAILAAIGMVFMGIPLPALWSLGVLIIAVIQLPPWLLLVPIAIYGYSIADPVPATVFLVWCLFVSVLDGFLKPILMGRGVDAPMLVILVGALGGMVMSGVMGLFIGAVIVAVVYRLILAWLQMGEPEDESGGDSGDEPGDAGAIEEGAAG